MSILKYFASSDILVVSRYLWNEKNNYLFPVNLIITNETCEKYLNTPDNQF